jgi:hypothetical protein
MTRALCLKNEKARQRTTRPECNARFNPTLGAKKGLFQICGDTSATREKRSEEVVARESGAS